MYHQNQKRISTKTIIVIALAIALLYSLLTNWRDIKRGFIDGWNNGETDVRQ